MLRSIWTPENSTTAKTMWIAGDSAATIAKTLGVTRNAVLGKAFRGEWPHPARPKMIWTPEAIETAKRMRAVGDNCAIIAKVLGTSSRAVFKKAWCEHWPRAARLTIWTPEAIETAKYMWDAGDSSTVIAKALGVSGQSVLVKARREGWPRPVRLFKWSPETVETAKRMWAAGDSASIIAKALGTTRSAVLGKAWRARWPNTHTRQSGEA
jgi:hypothetical protein